MSSMAFPLVAFADDVVRDEDRLQASFFQCGSVRIAIGDSEAFLTQREALELGSRLVAHAVAIDHITGIDYGR